MTDADRELLVLSARSARLELGWDYAIDDVMGEQEPIVFDAEGFGTAWNPLTDDGDALRLAVSLDLSVFPNDMPSAVSKYALVESHCGNFRGVVSWVEESKSAAVRRAIVNAAAEIGKAMP
jgi:hypothetical protein